MRTLQHKKGEPNFCGVFFFNNMQFVLKKKKKATKINYKNIQFTYFNIKSSNFNSRKTFFYYLLECTFQHLYSLPSLVPKRYSSLAGTTEGKKKIHAIFIKTLFITIAELLLVE